jgi:hypothetical protein
VITISALPDLIGMVGVTLVLLAFGLLNINKLTSLSMTYQIMNLTGSIFLLFSLFFHWNLSSVVIEIAWIMISSIGIFRVMKARKLQLAKSATTKLMMDEVLV